MKNNQSNKNKTLSQQNDKNKHKSKTRQLNQAKTKIAKTVKTHEKSDIQICKIIFFILPFIYGLFYEWSSCIIGIILCIGILVGRKNEKEKKSEDYKKMNLN